MYPRQHVILGAIFALILYFFFNFSITSLLIVFLSSVLIDIDHYLFYAVKKKDFSYRGAFMWYENQEAKARKMAKKGIRKKAYIHFLHTIEPHIILLIFSFISTAAFYIFIGFAFHSITDFIDLALTKTIYRREYFLTRWIYIKATRKIY